MGAFVDLTNTRFGKRVVIQQDYNSLLKGTYWIVECDCGAIDSVLASTLIRGKGNSCVQCKYNRTCLCGTELTGRSRKFCNHKCKSRFDSQRYRQEHPEKSRLISRKAGKKFREANPGYKRWGKIKSAFGLSRAEWEAIFAQQNHACAICETKQFGSKAPCNDHDHVTGKFRAILCNHCNVGLGRFKDRPDLLRKAANYVERFK